MHGRTMRYLLVAGGGVAVGLVASGTSLQSLLPFLLLLACPLMMMFMMGGHGHGHDRAQNRGPGLDPPLDPRLDPPSDQGLGHGHEGHRRPGPDARRVQGDERTPWR